jgi:hypothetical protein
VPAQERPRHSANSPDVKVSLKLAHFNVISILGIWPQPIQNSGFDRRTASLVTPATHMKHFRRDSLGLPQSTQNVFFWRPDKDGKAHIPETIASQLSHLIDPHATELDLPHGKVMLDADIGFSDRFATMRYATTFTCDGSAS